MPAVETPLVNLDKCQMQEDQKVTMVRAFIWCSNQQSLGSKMTPRYLYDVTGCVRDIVTDPSGLGLSRLRAPGMWSLYDLGKYISPILDNLKGELCMSNHLKPPPGCSIMSFNFMLHCLNKSPTTSIMESSTKPGESSSSEEAVSIRGVL